MASLSYFLFLLKEKEKYKYITSQNEYFTSMNVTTESQIKEKEDPKTFSLTLTGEQRKYLSYTALALLGYFLARHLVKSTVKRLKDNDD